MKRSAAALLAPGAEGGRSAALGSALNPNRRKKAKPMRAGL